MSFDEEYEKFCEHNYQVMKQHSTDSVAEVMAEIVGAVYAQLGALRTQARVLKERDPQAVEKAIKKFFGPQRLKLVTHVLEGVMNMRELITFRAGPQEPKTADERLALAIKEERYEDAAQIRDEKV